MLFYPLRVNRVINETHNAKSFELQPSLEHTPAFQYRSGQFLTVRIPWNEGYLERCYSLSSASEIDPVLKITIKRVENGLVSNWLNDHLKVGDTIEIAPPSGRFVLRMPPSSASPILMFAGGSGITPIISLLKTIFHTTTQPVFLLYANSNKASVIFYDELQHLKTKYSERFHCQYHFDDVSSVLNTQSVKTFMGHLDKADVYICGPAPFMDLVETVLDQHGMDLDRVFIERFKIAETTEEESRDQAPFPISSSTLVAPKISTFLATLDNQLHEIPYLEGHTLLECMLLLGLSPTHSCQEAHCGACMVIQKTGDTSMRKKNNILSRRDLSKGYILLCQAIPHSTDVWVDCDA